MGYYDDGYDSSDYEKRQERKKKQEQAKQRKVIRFQDISEEDARKQGGELLSKIVAAIPKYFNKSGLGYSGRNRREGIVFVKDKHVIRISLSLRPSAVVDYVVGAFQTKGWTAKHTFNDIEGYDFLDLSLPEDWLKRVLCIGRYNQKISDQKEEEKPKFVGDDDHAKAGITKPTGM